MATTTAPPSRAAIPTVTEARQGKGSVNWGRVAAWAAMIIIILITLFPFYWMLRTALSTSKSLFGDPSSLLPVDFTTGAFERVLGTATQEEAIAEGGSGAVGAGIGHGIRHPPAGAQGPLSLPGLPAPGGPPGSRRSGLSFAITHGPPGARRRPNR